MSKGISDKMTSQSFNGTKLEKVDSDQQVEK